MREFLRFVWRDKASCLVLLGVLIDIAGWAAAIPLTGEAENIAWGVALTGAVMVFLTVFFELLVSRLRRKHTHPADAAELMDSEDFIDQSDEEVFSDLLGVVSSAIMNGRVSAARTGLGLVPNPAAQLAFYEDVFVGTYEKTPGELRAMLVTAVDLAAQSLFVINGEDENRTLEQLRAMALALKGAHGEG